eukprot:TRINITY_DN2215_c0_g1_i1.p1 TRINITY_DN2215_c0_g1~~TRINITY_DN2215_c0_g1_i1.p1  ORF type:complete len:549 (-),score=209.53 TRINITY_DN2215_c0_g1_i1:61-1707(-)
MSTMEEESGLPRKKRGVIDSPSLDRPSKKQNLDSLDVPVSSWDEPTLRHQSRAMINKIKLLRENVQEAERKLESAQAKLLVSDEQLNISDLYWKQLHENIREIALRLKQGQQIESLKPYESKKESKREFSSYLSWIVKGAREENREDLPPSPQEVKLFLEERNKSVFSVLNNIVEVIEERDQVNQNLCAALKSQTNDEQIKLLIAENERLKTENYLSKQSIDELKSKNLESESRENKTQRAFNRLNDQVESLKGKILDEKDAAEEARAKLIRIQSKMTEEMEQIRSDFENHKENASLNAFKQEAVVKTEQNAATPQTFKESSEELVELNQMVQARNETIEKLESERETMIRDLEFSKNELTNLSVNRVASSRHFQQLQSQCAYLQSQLDATRREFDQVVSELKNERARNAREIDALVQNYSVILNGKDKSVKDRDDDLFRYRRERDEARGKLRALESSQFSKNAVSTLQTILDAKENECKKLRIELVKFKEDSDKLKTFKEDTKKNQEKLNDLVEQRNYELKEMGNKLRDNEKISINFRREKKWENFI